MYIWIGIDVSQKLKELKRKVEEVYKEMNYNNTIINLPYHISLKISFEANSNKVDDIINDLADYFSSLKPFSIETKAIENEKVICWIRFKENSEILRIKKEVNDLLNSKYQVPLHEYDLDFIFHTTLFMDLDKDKVSMFYEKIKKETSLVPLKLELRRFLIGTSTNGEPGTYVIVREISTR